MIAVEKQLVNHLITPLQGPSPQPGNESESDPVGTARRRRLQVRAVGQSGQAVGSAKAKPAHDLREAVARNEVCGHLNHRNRHHF